MREATKEEFNSVLRAHQTNMRLMQTGRTADFYYTKYGTGKEIAAKHEILSGGAGLAFRKVKSTTYAIDPAFLPGS
jgi:hypothetical protein